MGEPDLERLRAAWAEQTVDVARFAPEALHARNRRLARTLRLRNATELAAAAVVAAVFAHRSWTAEEPLVRLGAALLVAGAAVVAWTLARRAAPGRAPDAVAGQCFAWRRRALERQRILLATIWWWYLGPLMPGLGVLLLGMAAAAPTPEVRAAVGATGAVCAATFAALGALNRAAARRLAREIAALDEEVDGVA